MIADRPEWMARANCRGVDPELFFPERGAAIWQAQAVCAACPVRDECLEYALDNRETFGIWGGCSERERRRIRNGRKRRRKRAVDPERVAQLHAAGITAQDIADRLGCHVQTVYVALRAS